VSAGRSASSKKRLNAPPLLALVLILFNLHLPASINESVGLLGSATGGVALFASRIVMFSFRVAFNLTIGIAVIAGDPDSLDRRHPHRPVSDGRAGYGVASGFQHDLLDHHNGWLHLADALNPF
jgi:hypothetical protein